MQVDSRELVRNCGRAAGDNAYVRSIVQAELACFENVRTSHWQQTSFRYGAELTWLTDRRNAVSSCASSTAPPTGASRRPTSPSRGGPSPPLLPRPTIFSGMV